MDIAAVLAGGSLPVRRALFFFHWWTLNAVRWGRWKLHLDRFPRDPNRAQGRELPQLFDLELDPGETYDLKDRHPDVLDHLTGLAARFTAEIDAQRDTAEARAAGRVTAPRKAMT
ncbi:hypothetical protein C1I92_19145 [Jiangella anatolica]|uniref:N-sulphoglucosamine sulphohydrolase C-terminal domain-containing protein n=1 Tax=Jiangella anatolica TaxID=2670374 RepID=A0A2W2CNX5_9ACTN|nr:hypothetical protein C1I92_19145 [Jiangella anatolica]